MRAEVIDGKLVKRFAHNLMARGAVVAQAHKHRQLTAIQCSGDAEEVLPEKVRSVMMTNELCTASGIKKCRK